MGELLLAMEKAKGGGEPGVGRRGKKNAVPRKNRIPAPTYAELGIDKKVAARSQRRFKAGREAHEARADQAAVKAVAAVDADVKKEAFTGQCFRHGGSIAKNLMDVEKIDEVGWASITGRMVALGSRA